jgi:hypothetical protein
MRKYVPHIVPGHSQHLTLRRSCELECIAMFGYPLDTVFSDPALKDNSKFMKKVIAMVVALDIAVGFLGPDLEPIESQLVELGRRHGAHGCKPKHWHMVEEALFHVFEVALGEKFTPEIQMCWEILFNFLGYHMIQGLISYGGPTEWETSGIRPSLHESYHVVLITLRASIR